MTFSCVHPAVGLRWAEGTLAFPLNGTMGTQSPGAEPASAAEGVCAMLPCWAALVPGSLCGHPNCTQPPMCRALLPLSAGHWGQQQAPGPDACLPGWPAVYAHEVPLRREQEAPLGFCPISMPGGCSLPPVWPESASATTGHLHSTVPSTARAGDGDASPPRRASAGWNLQAAPPSTPPSGSPLRYLVALCLSFPTCKMEQQCGLT